MSLPIDLAYAFLFTVAITTYETFVAFPRFKARVAAGVPSARLDAYRRTVIGQWAFALIAVVLWVRAGRPWSQLGLVPPADARIVISVALVAIMAALAVHQIKAIRRSTAARRVALRSKLAYVEFMLPHT